MTKTLITCGNRKCVYNENGYCRKKNIHISSADRTCDAYHEYSGQAERGGEHGYC